MRESSRLHRLHRLAADWSLEKQVLTDCTSENV
ncbi:hypothetical protein FHR71_005493 [Methylobacterium sp. RAS18]|nr:hypothetical protein [Methylobacterium sp. RAS18]